MTTEKLMDAIGLLPADLVAAADRRRTAPRKPAIRWRRWAALAACAVLLLGVGQLVLPNLPGMGGSRAPMEEAAQADAPAAMPEELTDEVCAEEPRENASLAQAPEHPLPLTIQWNGESITVESSNYTVTTQNPDGTAETTIACGAHPLDANLEPHQVNSTQVTLLWAQMPDEITVLCWMDGGNGETGAGSASVAVNAGILTLSEDGQIYEITARWGEECTASYGVWLEYQIQ